MATPHISNSSQHDASRPNTQDENDHISPSTSIRTAQAYNATNGIWMGGNEAKYLDHPEFYAAIFKDHPVFGQSHQTRPLIHSTITEGMDAKSLFTSEGFRIPCKRFLDFVSKNHFENLNQPPKSKVKLIKNFGQIFTDAEIIDNPNENEYNENNTASCSLLKGSKSKSNSVSYSVPKTASTADLSSSHSAEDAANHQPNESTLANNGPAASLTGELTQKRPKPKVKGGKKKRNPRILHDYFNSNQNGKMYSLIRHSFSSEYDKDFWQKPESDEIVQQYLDTCRNTTSAINPTDGWIKECKILLISQNSIRKARQNTRRFRPPTTCNIDEKDEFQTYLFNGSIKRLKAIYEDKICSAINPKHIPKSVRSKAAQETIVDPRKPVYLDHDYFPRHRPLSSARQFVAQHMGKSRMKSLVSKQIKSRQAKLKLNKRISAIRLKVGCKRMIPVPEGRIETNIALDNMHANYGLIRFRMGRQEVLSEFDVDSLMNIPRKLNREKCLQQNPTIDKDCGDEKIDFITKSLLKMSHTFPGMLKQTLINHKFKYHFQLLRIFDQHKENILNPEYLIIFGRLIFLINHGRYLSKKETKTPFEKKLLSFIQVYLRQNYTLDTLASELVCYAQRSVDFVRRRQNEEVYSKTMQEQEQYWQERDEFKAMGFDEHQIVELIRASKQNDDPMALNRLIRFYKANSSNSATCK